MSSLDGRSTDKLADIVLNVLWPDLLEVFEALKNRLDSEGPDSIKAAFEGATSRFLEGPFLQDLQGGGFFYDKNAHFLNSNYHLIECQRLQPVQDERRTSGTLG